MYIIYSKWLYTIDIKCYENEWNYKKKFTIYLIGFFFYCIHIRYLGKRKKNVILGKKTEFL